MSLKLGRKRVLQVREFTPADFEGVVTCYQAGFLEGHNRYSLSRLARFQRDTIFVAEDTERRLIVGVIIGITSYKEAWLTGMSVLPETRYRLGRCSLLLLHALGQRLVELGFSRAFGSTRHRAIRAIAHTVGARLVSEEDDFYFDGKKRWIYEGDASCLNKLEKLMSQVRR